MDNYLAMMINDDTPKINPDIANGLAVKHMADTERYVDSVFQAAARDFPTGLTYAGCQRCTPQEEYNFVTSRKNNKRTVDIARSDVYLMKYFFKHNGVMLPPRFIYLPFVTDGGFISLGGSKFVISPVLADKVISLATTNVFIRLLRDKLTFERAPHNIIIDGKRETIQVVWSLIYHRSASVKKAKYTVKANCSLVHYLLCKHGFTETFRKYGKCNPVVGTKDINTTNYPASEWVICESTGAKPKGSYDNCYQGTDIKIAIRRNEFTHEVRSLVTGFYYIVDHFPNRVSPQFLNHDRLWMVLMGHILFSGNIGEGKLYNDVSEHFESLDEYIDMIVSERLKDIGYPCENIYDLFSIVINNFNEWIIKSKDSINSMYGKELNILYFVLLGITSAIFKLHFKLKKASSKKQMEAKDVTNIMNTILKPGMIYTITSQHSGVSNVSYSGDNKYFEITSMLIAQKSSSKQATGNDRQNTTDPAKRMHVSVPEVGGYLNHTKSEPSGRSQLNPHVHLDDRSNVIRDPDKIPLLDKVQEMIRRD